MPERQVQRGGETQLQAGRDVNVTVGLDVAAVTEIFNLQAAVLRHELTAHAEAVVTERLAALAGKMVGRFDSPELLPAFADPDFQFNVLEAQRAAARSGNDEDLDLIVDVLTQRAITPPTPRLKLATRRALDVVGQVDSQQLGGLTAFWYGISLVPIVDTLEALLDRTNKAVAPFVEQGLPPGNAWQTDMQILDCLHAQPGSLGGIIDYAEFTGSAKAAGFTAMGMDEATAGMVRDGLAVIHPGLTDLVESHPFGEGRYRLVGRSEEEARTIVDKWIAANECDAADVIAALDFAIDQNQYGSRHPATATEIAALIDAQPHLPAYRDWWNAQHPLSVTAPGRVIAYANFRRVNSTESLPPLSQLIGD